MIEMCSPACQRLLFGTASFNSQRKHAHPHELGRCLLPVSIFLMARVFDFDSIDILFIQSASQ